MVDVCGSLRAGSRTCVALREALTAAEEAGARTELVGLREYELPPLRTVETVPDAEALRRTLRRADSLLLSTPNYYGTYSGWLKNVLYHCSRDELEGTTVGLLEVAAG